MNSTDVRGDEPSTVAERLRADPKLVLKDSGSSSGYLVRLDMENGYFQLNWAAGTTGTYDWVGLYVNRNMLDKDYIGGDNWQWAVRPSPYTTSTPAQAGYQARYLVWDAMAKAYKAVAKTDPWQVEDTVP